MLSIRFEGGQRTGVRWLGFAILFCIGLTVTQPAAALGLSLRCGFDFNGQRYEWMVGDGDTEYWYINDRGQVVATNFDRDRPIIAFIDEGSAFPRTITRYSNFAGEYEDRIQIVPKAISNDGEVFGDVYLATNNPNGDFTETSTQFAFVWDSENGFRDLATLVAGISGREDVGFQTGIGISSGAPRLITYDAIRGGEIYNEPLPFETKANQRTLPDAIGDAAADAQDCGGSNPIVANSSFDTPLTNDNHEFISGRNLVRLAKPRAIVYLDHYWVERDAEGNSAISYGSTGSVGNNLVLQYEIANTSVMDIQITSVTLEYFDDTDVLLETFRDSAPSTLAQGQGSGSLLVYHAAQSAGSTRVRMRVEVADSNGNTATFYSNIRSLTVEGGGTTLEIETDRNSYDLEDDEANHRYNRGVATLRVSSSDADNQRVQFSNPVITVDRPELLDLTSPSVPSVFEISQNSSDYTLDIPFTALAPGVARITSAIDVTDTVAGTTETIETTESVVISPLRVDVSVLPENIKVNDTPTDELTPRLSELPASRYARP